MDRNKIKMNKNLLLVLAFLLFNIIGYGQTFKTWTGATSTAWETGSNWDTGEAPTSVDDVLITNAVNQPVISDLGASCAALILSNSTAGSDVTLTVKTGSFTTASITMNSTGGNTSDCSLRIGTGKISVTGNIVMTGNDLQNDVTFSAAGNLSIGGIMNGGTLNSNGVGTVTYNGIGTRNVGPYTYNNLTFSGSGVRTVTPEVIVNGTFTMAGTAKASAAPTYGANAALQYSGVAITVGPEWITPFIAKGGIEIIQGTTVTLNSAIQSEKRFNDGVQLLINEEASLLVTNTELYFGGNFINNWGSLTTDKFVYLTGGVNQTIASFTSTEGISMIKSAGVATFTGNMNTKNLIINGLGTLNLGIGLTHTFTSDWTRTQGTLNGGSSILKIGGNVVGTGGNLNAGTGTVEFNGGIQNLGTGSIIYNNLILSGTATKTFGAKTTINGTFSILNGVVADLTANLVHSAKYIKLGTTAEGGGSWGSSKSNAVNKNDTYFVLNNGIVNVGPTIVINSTSVAGLTTIYGTPSGSGNFTISGTDIVGGILVTPPAGFEVSTDGVTFSDTVSVGTAAYIPSTKVYIRLKGTIAVGSYTGNIVLTSTGTTTINIPIATSTVNKAPLKITANDNSKVYGSENPVLTASYVGFVNGDTEASLTTPVTITTTAVKGSSVGTYAITTSGADLSNYNITYANGKLTITPATLSITANDASKVYGSDNPVLTASYVGFVNGDTQTSLTTAAKIETTAVKGSSIGTYEITVSGAVLANYNITYTNGKLTITPAALLITANNNTKVYGSDNPVLTASYVGFVNGDTAASLTTPATITTTAVKGSPIGSYEIAASGAALSNYTIIYGTNASLTITPAALLITANNNSKVYGSDNPVLTASYVGFVNGDTAASLTTPATIETTAVKGSSIGTYAITASGAALSNYAIAYTNGILTITPANLTITTLNQQREYGIENPVLTANYVGFANGDTEASLTTAATISTTATKGSAVGTYPITVSGAVSSNYTITYGQNALLTITPAALTVTADNQRREFGIENPVLTASYVGFRNGDTEASLTTSTKIATLAVKESPVGEYEITVSEAVSPNYSITFKNGTLTVIKSSNAGLTDLAISEGTLSPTFSEGTKDYTATVPNDVTSITVTPVTADPTAIVTVNGEVVPSGTPTNKLPLVVGENEIITVVTAQDGTINTYTVIVTREPSTDAGLADITVSEGTLSPAFNADTKGYTVDVPNATDSIVITPTPKDPDAKVEMIIDGKTITDNTAPIDLKVGDNVVTVVVTAPDGTTQETYTVIVTREPSSDAGLADITVSEGTLSPAFDVDTKGYTVDVPNATDSIIITPTSKDPDAKVEMIIDGKTITDNTAPIDLKVGDNVVTVVVTAPDGTTQETYTVVVTREPSSDAGLADITVSEGTLSPAFNTDTKGYTVDVPNATDSIVITPTPKDADAKVEMKIGDVTIDPTAPIDLKVGDNVVTVVVTAPDGTQETYTVVVTRDEPTNKPSDNAGLSDIALSDGTLSPAFNTDTKGYTVDVPNATDSIVITPKPIDPAAKVEMIVDGVTIDPSSPIDLKVGENVVTVVVTAEDGTQETYTVIVNRADAVPQAIVPTNIITPNGDGKNDYWIIDGLDKYPNNSVKVFDRAARLVYSKNNYNNDWDGSYKGSPLNEDTYYYLIDLGNGSPKIKGFISIIRN